MDTPLGHLDAEKFQKQLVSVAETVAQKVKREAPGLLPGIPGFVSADLHLLVRQAMNTYDLMFYLNADERRDNDCYWRPAYSVVAFPLIRNMIDGLYNITHILQNPGANGPWFRISGFKKALAALEEDEARYRGRPEWDAWIAKGRDFFDFQIRSQGFSMAQVIAQPAWPTLGQYIKRQHQGGARTSHQLFLESLLYGPWREYSAMAHGGSEGLMRTGIYYISDSLTHEQREDFEKHNPRMLFMHITRAAAILLCIATELQAYFRFDGARINERICEVWDVLMPAFEVKELYDERYRQLMEEKRLIP